MSSPRVRIAPSPTGHPHIGTARTALFNWLYARGRGGVFILRIEDTDRERSQPEHAQAILDGLGWLGLDWDELAFQSGSVASHRAAVQALVGTGAAYRDANPPEQVRAWKDANPGRGYRGTPSSGGDGVVMLRMPDEPITFVDEVRGELVKDGRELHDEVLARTDGSPLYNLAVIVDDHDDRITHVVRGEDHISNTFKQVAIARALGYEAPRYAHLALIHDSSGRKYSKRHQAPGVDELRAAGYTAQTVRNTLALLGWWPRDDRELMTDAEMIAAFDLADCSKSATRLDPDKMRWLSGHKLRRLPVADYAAELAAFRGVPVTDRLLRAVQACREKASTLVEAWSLIGYAFTDEPIYDEKAWRRTMKGGADRHLQALSATLADCAWDPAAIKAALDACVPDDVGPGMVFQPLRVALTGSTVSPYIEDTVWLLDRERALARIAAARVRMGA